MRLTRDVMVTVAAQILSSIFTWIPPEGEVVVSVDAKSGIQALDRTQPLLPIDFGKTPEAHVRLRPDGDHGSVRCDGYPDG